MIGYNYKSKNKIFSISKWENSYFGGYSNIIYSFPEIKISDKIILQPSKEFNLSLFASTKLLKMFILEIKSRSLYAQLFFDYKIEKIAEKTYMVINMNSIDSIINKLEGSEIYGLFDNFRDNINQSSILIDITEEDKKKNDDENKEKESDGEETPLTEKELLDVASKEINDTKKQKLYSSYYSHTPFEAEVQFKTIDPKKKKAQETVYTYEEILLANKLLQKLDIDFDFTSDKLVSLKQGKLDVSKLAEAVSGNDHIHYRIEENMLTKPFSVTILCDESGSMMSENKINLQHSLVKILYKAFSEILPPEKIEVYGHSTCPYKDDILIHVYQDSYNLNFEKTIDEMLDHAYEENYDLEVMTAVYNKIRSKTEESVLFIVISDGQPCGPDDTVPKMKKLVEKMRRDNFVTAGIGFQDRTVSDIYSYNTIINNFSKLSEQVTTLLNRIVKTEFQ